LKDLLDAIYAKYNLNDSGVFAALRAANTGGLYLVKAKEQQEYPYMTLNHIVGSISYTSTSVLKEATVQFSIFSDVFSEVMTIYDKLCSAFDDTTLTYDNDTAIVMQRINETGPLVFEDVWQVTIDYQVIRE